MTMKTKLLMMVAAVVLAASCGAPAFGEPASIDDGSGPRDVGAQIEDASGAPGPDYSKAQEKPSRGDYATDADFRMAVAGWEAGERARLANLAAGGGR